MMKNSVKSRLLFDWFFFVSEPKSSIHEGVEVWYLITQFCNLFECAQSKTSNFEDPATIHVAFRTFQITVWMEHRLVKEEHSLQINTAIINEHSQYVEHCTVAQRLFFFNTYTKMFCLTDIKVVYVLNGSLKMWGKWIKTMNTL